jgi:hypothetical protein
VSEVARLRILIVSPRSKLIADCSAGVPPVVNRNWFCH